jgi:hypothetical protein
MRSPIDSLTFHHRKSFPLFHTGDCAILGVDKEFTIYAEEMYGEIGYVAQAAIRFSGDIIATVDEQNDDGIEPLEVPKDCAKPHSAWQTMALNFAGARHRGLREADRTTDLVKPLTLADKIALTQRIRHTIQPTQILGIAESYVLTEARLSPTSYFVCRRLRIAYALSQLAHGADGLGYDYDTFPLYLAHGVDLQAQTEPSLEMLLADLPDVALFRPMDCILCRDHLFIAEGGSAKSPDQPGRLSQIHVWTIQGLPASPNDENTWSQKLYG